MIKYDIADNKQRFRNFKAQILVMLSIIFHASASNLCDFTATAKNGNWHIL